MSVATMEKPNEISLAQQFSKFPAGRYVADGPFSGEAFREKLLVPAMKSNRRLIVDLDGTAGFGSSFLEEAFGGLVRSGWTSDEIISRIEFKCSDPSVIDEIVEYIRSATKAHA